MAQPPGDKQGPPDRKDSVPSSSPGREAEGTEVVRRGYHHGHLKQALLEAGRALLRDRGAAGFSLADAAKLAGVSAAAPYRHFRDKDALLAEIASEGFRLFGERLQSAIRSDPSPQAAFAIMGQAYLAFAREEPGLYDAMFTWCSGPHAAASPVPQRCFDLLIAGIEMGLAFQKAPTDLKRQLAVQVWAMSHGLAMLARNGQLAAGTDVDAMLLDGVEMLLRGARLKVRATAAGGALSDGR